MALFDDTRSTWDARSPKSKPVLVVPSRRTEFFNHYDGGHPLGLAAKAHSACLAQVKADQAFHMDGNGWSDIGYNGLVCQHGRAIEGRGIDAIGAHCTDHNTTGYGFQFMVGGTESPTPAAFARMAQLYADCTARSGHALAKKGHRDGFATACPGDLIQAWVKAGMTTTTALKSEEDDMAVADEIKGYIRAVLIDGYDVAGQSYPGMAKVDIETQRRVTVLAAQVQTLSVAVKALAESKGADAAAITSAVVSKIEALDLSLTMKEKA